MHRDSDGTRRLIVSCSAVLGVILVASSTFGLIRPSDSYPSASLRLALVPNDAVNLLVGVPILLASAYLTGTMSTKFTGSLLLPGALAYHLYSSLTYVLAIPPSFGAVFMLQLAAVLVSLGALWGSCSALDGSGVRALIQTVGGCGEAVGGSPPTKLGGAALTIWGGLFLIRAVGMMLLGGESDRAESAVCAADAIIGPAWVWIGMELYRGTAAGYGLGLGVLFQASALFIALVIVLVLRPFLVPGTAVVPLTDVAVVAAMGLTVAFPFVRFLRIVWENEADIGAIDKGK